jgi:hypothetical protein
VFPGGGSPAIVVVEAPDVTRDHENPAVPARGGTARAASAPP